MGQQQLLLVVLTIFVIGLTVLTGVRLVASLNQSNDRDLVLHQMTVLVGEAKKYSNSPKSIGGGEGSFIGFNPINKLTVTSNVRIYVTTGPDWILFQGYGTTEGYDGVNPVAVVAQYDKSIDRFSTVSNIN